MGQALRVAWIGLGAMGAPMAAKVARAGHQVAGYARRPDGHDALRSAGGRVSPALLQTVAGAELVCVTLFSEQQIREVVLDAGVLAAIPDGAILAIHSTVSPACVRALAAERPAVDVLDAGFSGGPNDADLGKLTLMVGGGAAAFDRARPVFTAYADHIAHVGPLGSGMTLKVINNLTFAANVAIARDALRLVKQNGLDLAAACATLSRGSAASMALTVIGSGENPDTRVAAIRRFLDKDVAIARQNAVGMTLGALDAATSEFIDPV